MEITQFLESLFTFDAYWKVAALVIFLSTGLAYSITHTVNLAGKKIRKGEADPVWWSLALRGLSLTIGTAVGLAVDLFSVAPLAAEGANVSAPVLSALLGLFSGAFCSTIVWFVKMRLAKRNPELANAPLDNDFE